MNRKKREKGMNVAALSLTNDKEQRAFDPYLCQSRAVGGKSWDPRFSLMHDLPSTISKLAFAMTKSYSTHTLIWTCSSRAQSIV